MPELKDIFGREARPVRTVPRFPHARDTSGYQVDGVRVPSVTEVLQLAGLSEFPGIPKDVLENAADRGKWAHHFCDLIDHEIDYSDDEVPDEVLPRLDAYRRFLDESGFEPTHVEEVVVSKVYQFAGTADRVGKLPGIGRALVDLKLPIKRAPQWKLQTAGYRLAFTESTGLRIDARYTLQLSKAGTYDLSPADEDGTDRDDFLSAVRVAHFKLRNGTATLEN